MPQVGENSVPIGSLASDSVLEAIIDDFLIKLGTTSPPAIDDIVARYPAEAERLRQLLPAVMALAMLKDSDQDREKSLDSAAGITPELRELGDFQLIRELGRGGMGVVYEAQQISLNRRVALKILPFASVFDPRQLERFKNEARAAATLGHPHIVPVHAVGQDRGVHFYAMQLIEGQSLSEFVDDVRSEIPTKVTSIPPEREDTPSKGRASVTEDFSLSAEVIDLRHDYVRQVAVWGIHAAEALEHAHQRGIVHRDIKPSNLLIDSRGYLWVTDFGIATGLANSNLTMTGDLLGTLRYMSPEQILGNRNILDHRTDVYSLGVTLYELLALQPAFPQTDRVRLLQQIEQEDPPRSPFRKRSVPLDLELIVYKAMHKSPQARYATTQEFADDLRRFLDNEQILARPQSLSDHVTRWSRRNQPFVKAMLLAGPAMLLVIAIAVGIILQFRMQVPHERPVRKSEADIGKATPDLQPVHQYVTEVNLAKQALVSGNLTEMQNRLNNCRPATPSADWRGVEWSYLSNLQQSVVQKIGQHQGAAYCSRVSPDGSRLVTSGKDGIRIWQLSTNRLEKSLTEHRGDVNAAGFSPDGRWLVSSSDDGTALLWETESWTVQRELQHSGPTGGARFTPDGNLVVTGEWKEDYGDGNCIGENLIRVWDSHDGRIVGQMRGHQHRLTAGDLSDDGRTVISGDLAGNVHVWKIPEGTLEQSFKHFEVGPAWAKSVSSIDLAHQHPWAATTGLQSTLNLWNINDGSLVKRLRTSHSHVRCAAFSPDDKHLISGGDADGGTTINVWKLQGNGDYEISAAISTPATVWSICFLDAHQIAFTDADGNVYRWNLSMGVPEYRIRDDQPGRVFRSAVSPDGRWIAYSGNGIRVAPMEDLENITTLDERVDSDRPVAFSPDGKYLVGTRKEKAWELWSTLDWKRLEATPMQKQSTEIVDFHFLEGGTRLAVQSDKNEVRWYDFPPTNQLARREAINGTVMPGTDLGDWINHQENLHWYDFSPRGSLLAVAYKGGKINLHDATTLDIQAICLGRQSLPTGIAFSADERTLAVFDSVSDLVTLWNVPTGRELFTIPTGLRVIRSLAFSSENKHLVLAGQDQNGHGTVIVQFCRLSH